MKDLAEHDVVISNFQIGDIMPGTRWVIHMSSTDVNSYLVEFLDENNETIDVVDVPRTL